MVHVVVVVVIAIVCVQNHCSLHIGNNREKFGNTIWVWRARARSNGADVCALESIEYQIE